MITSIIALRSFIEDFNFNKASKIIFYMEFRSFNLGNYKNVDVNLDVGYPQKYHQFPQIELLSIVLESLQ